MKSINTLLSALFFLSAIVGIHLVQRKLIILRRKSRRMRRFISLLMRHRLFHWKQVSNLLW